MFPFDTDPGIVNNYMKDRVTRLYSVYQLLKKEYPGAKTFLHHRNPYELMVAVILSARTTDAQVNRITPVLFEKYPDPEALMNADAADVEELVFSTGFYRSKARSIIGAAAEVVRRYNGAIPESMDDLLSLPGVGRKSANVIRAHAFSKPAVIVDTHFSRVVGRLGLTDKKEPEKIEREIALICPAEIQSDFSMVINIQGRNVCTARRPECGLCAVRKLCLFPGND